ncbi:MAG: thioredoxin family protein [Chitinophagales bacterium]|nr:thioredoxin family protein [Bacteroidota bacterium]MCB9043710.1 thioredoxin family protein [Chitinophagales bacterium]
MRLSLLLVALLYTTFVFAQRDKTPEMFQEMSFEQALNLAAETGKPIFVETYATWCKPCKWMEKNTFKDEELTQLMQDYYIAIRLDVDREGKRFANEYGVRMVPTMFFLNSEGKVLRAVEGAQEAKDLLKIGSNIVKRQKH